MDRDLSNPWLSLWHIISFLLIIYAHGCKFEFGYKHVKSWGLSFVIGLTGIKALLCNTHLRYYCQCPSLSSLLRGRYGSKAKTWVVLCWVFVRILLSNPTPVVTHFWIWKNQLLKHKKCANFLLMIDIKRLFSSICIFEISIKTRMSNEFSISFSTQFYLYSHHFYIEPFLAAAIRYHLSYILFQMVEFIAKSVCKYVQLEAKVTFPHFQKLETAHKTKWRRNSK